MNLIGIGSSGCAVVDILSKHPQYNIFKIDFDLKGKKKDGEFSFPHADTPEDCETVCPSMKYFFKDLSGSTTVFVSGSDLLCAASLKILQEIQNKAQITLVYMRPDIDLIDHTSRMLDRVAFNIFQEYARSGLFDRLFLISHELLTAAVGEVPVTEFQGKLTELLASTFHMVATMENTAPVYGNHTAPIDIARISTMGMLDAESEEESLLYQLQYPREKTFYYLIPRETLNSDEKLMTKILKQVKQRVKDDKIKLNFGVYETDYDQSYIYVVSSSSIIQGRKLD